MFEVIVGSVMPPLLVGSQRAANLTIRSTFGQAASEHAQSHHLVEAGGSHDDALDGEERGGLNTNYLFLIIPNAWAILSNAVVILTILRTPAILRSFAYVMISLSLVDLCSSLFVIPFSIYFFANHTHWGLGYPLCVLWTAADVMLCTASICHHCAIALHRYLIISNPHDFSVTNNHKIIYRLIAPAWAVSALIAVILVIRSTVDSDLIYDATMEYCGINDRSYAVYSSIVSFFIPLSIIVVVSIRSIFILQRRIAFKRHSHMQGKRKSLHHHHQQQPYHNRSRAASQQLSEAESWQQSEDVSPPKRRMSVFFDRFQHRLNANRRCEDEDDDKRTSSRIIFASFKHRHSNVTKTNSGQRREAAARTLLRAFESFSVKSMTSASSNDAASQGGFKFNNLIMSFGPRYPLSRPSSTVARAGIISEHSVLTTGSDSPKRNFASSNTAEFSQITQATTVSVSSMGQFRPHKPIPEMSESSSSHFTSDEMDIYDKKAFKSKVRNSKSLNFQKHINAMKNSSTTISMLDPAGLYALPDIDRSISSCSERTSIGGDFGNCRMVRRGRPLSITEIAALDFQTGKITIIDDPPPLPYTPGHSQPTSPPMVSRFSRLGFCLNSRNGSIASRIRAPIARMSSLEKFDSSSIATPQSGSPAFKPNKNRYLSSKTSRRRRSSKNLQDQEYSSSGNSTPQINKKKAFSHRLNSLTTCESFNDQITPLPHEQSPVPPTSATFRRQSDTFFSYEPSIGGPYVPEHFKEMVRKKDHERQVALVKRGKTVAPIIGRKHYTSFTGTANRHLTSLRRVLSSVSTSSQSQAEKDIAMQTLARRIKKEKQAGHALLVVLLCFVLMWAPFFTLNTVYGICGDCVSKGLFSLFSWAGWASCGVNPIIYTLCSRQFRQGLFHSLRDIFNRVRNVGHDRGRGVTRQTSFGRSFINRRSHYV